ncbi:MAG: O-antigen ligase family protein [Acidimicrobiales bacterium]
MTGRDPTAPTSSPLPGGQRIQRFDPDAGRIPAGLLVAVVVALVPAWALGLFPFVWMAVIPPVLVWGTRRGWSHLGLPRYFGLWVVFLVFLTASVVQVEGAGGLAVWGLRFSWYLAATLLLIYLLNQREATVPIGLSLVGLWAITVAGGWAGMLAAETTWTGPLANLLPGLIRENSYVVDLTSPSLAEVQRVGGEVLRRPSAPFAYTNNWGSTVALLTPIAIATATGRRFGMSRTVVVVLFCASLPPLLLSLNRGAWLSLAIGMTYAGAHVLRRNRRMAIFVLATLVAVAAVAIAVGAIGMISDQLSARTAASNDTRSALYAETISETIESPLLGYGSPRQSTELEGGPPVGTHGQLWMVMFSHGILAAIGYVGFFVATFLAVPARSPSAVLAKASLLVGIVQLPFYGHLPQQLFVMMALVAFLYHENERCRRGAAGADRLSRASNAASTPSSRASAAAG